MLKKSAADKAAWTHARERALKSAEAMTDEEDAKLTAAALADPDNPPTSCARWRPAVERFPDIVAAYEAGTLVRRRGQRGPQKAPTKRRVTLRIDRDVLEAYEATGTGWHARINEALRKAVKL